MEDYYKNKPKESNYSKCSQCGDEFISKDSSKKICDNCENQNFRQTLKEHEKLYGYYSYINCYLCGKSFVPVHENELYCFNCVFSHLDYFCIKCGSLKKGSYCEKCIFRNKYESTTKDCKKCRLPFQDNAGFIYCEFCRQLANPDYLNINNKY